MAFKKKFLVSDESINTYGFWIRMMGMSLDNAKKNCPAYFNHRTWEIPLGHWEGIELDNKNQLWATIVIEGANELEKDYIRKIENGDMKGASIGADPKVWSKEELFLKEGQTVATLWECELFEISLAPLPGNKNALCLKNKGSMINLGDNTEHDFIPSLKPSYNMKAIALKLGLKEDATEQQILDAIAGVQLSASNSEAMRSHIETLGKEELESDDAKALFVELTKSNFSQAVSFLKLNKKPPAEAVIATPGAGKTTLVKDIKVSELIKPGIALGAATETGKDSYDYLQRHNAVELARIHKEEPDKYKELATAYKNGIRYKA